MPPIAPHLFVIFGATGDLAHRKLLPALFHLMQRRDLSRQIYVLGASRSALSDEEYRDSARASLFEQGFSEKEVTAWCDQHLFYQSLGPNSDRYGALVERIETLEGTHDLSGNRVLYLALPPQTFAPTLESVGAVGLDESPGWTRLVVEKPFGYDLPSARELNALVHRYFDEGQIFRIDHFLGKETVQNLLAFRFANALFESAWNRDRIERVEITVSETLGLEGRAGYYDRSGQLRDMVQNHLTQLLTLIAMEPPAAFESDALRHEKVKVLNSIPPIDPDHVVFGQYTSGQIDGQEVPGYLDEEGIEPTSATETFVALRLHVANWRWQGVPFFLRTGKRMPRPLRQIAVHFRRAPISIFQPHETTCELSSNVLLITLQPDEGFDLHFEVKRPGEPFRLKTEQLSFRYEQAFGPIPDAYETLLYDVITGDQMLFVHADEVEAAWKLFGPLLEKNLAVHPYSAGSWGPAQTKRMLYTWTNGR